MEHVPSPENLDELVAQCIDLLDHEGPEALDVFLENHRADADRLRRRLGALSKLGLLTSRGQGPPEVIGPYRLIRQLGAGGMGEVHLATHSGDGSRVALKLGPRRTIPLSTDHDASVDRASERFAREVRAVAAIDHPGIVPILDVGEHEGRAWFAMALVEGVGLDQILAAVRARGTRPEQLRGSDMVASVPGAVEGAFGSTWVEAVGRVVLQVAEALTEAHVVGVVHRDVKPSNVLVRPDGCAQIVDFGLAHLDELPTLTLSGEFAGTPYYVAPEQIANTKGAIDGRADVFSLGVTLYECASLARPFAGRTPTEVIASISGREPTPLRRVAPHLPADLERLCHRALEKDKRVRYPSMAAFADDLRRLLDFRPLLSKPPSPLARAKRWARLRPWRAASIAMAGILVVGAPVGLLLANAQVRKERDLVRDEAMRRGAVVEHLVAHFESSGSSSAIDDAARALLDRGVERLDHDFGDQPRVRAALLHASGRAYLELGHHAAARPLLDRSYALWRRTGDDGREERARVLVDLARVHLREGNPERAKDLASRALGELSGADPAPDLVDRVRATVAAASVALGDARGARLELAEVGVATDAVRSRIARVWEAIGRHELEAGDATLARDAFSRALDLGERAWSPDAEELARVHDGLASVARAAGGARALDAIEHTARAARLRASAHLESASSPQLPFRREPLWAANYASAFDRGIAALQADRLAEAREAFLLAFDRKPRPAVAAYNLACVEARSGDLQLAAEWLEQALHYGFACTEERAHALRRDTDLLKLRQSSVGRPVIRALEAQWGSAQLSFERAALIVPTRANRLMPLLIVLHDDGEVAETVARAGWDELAEGLGAILLVPSAPYFFGVAPGDGGVWSPDARDLWRRVGVFGRPVLEQVRGVLDRENVDRERVWIVGCGVGGMLALDLLTESPGLFRGGLLIDPVLHERSGAGAGALAAALGNRLAVMVTDAPVSPYQLKADVDGHSLDLERWLRHESDWGAALRLERGDDSADRRQSMLEWIRSE